MSQIILASQDISRGVSHPEKVHMVFTWTSHTFHRVAPSSECGLKKLKLFFPHTLWVSSRMLLLSGDIEQNPGPFNQCTDNLNGVCPSTTNTVSLLDFRLSELGRTAIETGGGGDCFFRSVSHQVYGSPNDHFYVRSLGIQHLTHHPELFIESNTEYSWQTYLNNMKQQGTWADGIIIQAVANALNLTINIIESNTNFSPVTVINPINTERDSRNIYIGHIGELHYVSTEVKSNLNPERPEIAHGDKAEKHRAYMREHIQKKQESTNKKVQMAAGDILEKCAASKRGNMQKQRANTAYRETENKSAKTSEDTPDKRDKVEKRRASKRAYMQKRRANAAYRETENKKVKISAAEDAPDKRDKIEKRRASKRAYMQKQRANAAYRETGNKKAKISAGGNVSEKTVEHTPDNREIGWSADYSWKYS